VGKESLPYVPQCGVVRGRGLLGSVQGSAIPGGDNYDDDHEEHNDDGDGDNEASNGEGGGDE
jgi:hypothetical protein